MEQGFSIATCNFVFPNTFSDLLLERHSLHQPPTYHSVKPVLTGLCSSSAQFAKIIVMKGS